MSAEILLIGRFSPRGIDDDVGVEDHDMLQAERRVRAPVRDHVHPARAAEHLVGEPSGARGDDRRDAEDQQRAHGGARSHRRGNALLLDVHGADDGLGLARVARLCAEPAEHRVDAIERLGDREIRVESRAT